MDYLSEDREEFKKIRIRRAFKESIEPEEVLMDAQKNPEFQDQKLETPLKGKIFSVFFGFILLSLLALVGFAGYSQIFKGKEYLALANRNSQRAYPIAPPRGLIYDRNLKPLVSNIKNFDVFLFPLDLPEGKSERENTIEQISEILGLNSREINQKLLDFDFQKEQRILLAESLTLEEISTIQLKEKDFPALHTEETVRRQYLFGETASHILGYTGRLSSKDAEEFSDYFSVERIGKLGIEAEYENYLRGEIGANVVEVDSTGRQTKEVGTQNPTPGQNVVTTIDMDLQQALFQALKKETQSIKAAKASAVAMDPGTGQVLAMVSLPSFDDSVFEQGDSSAIESLLADSDQPLFNRAISGQYASGSTIKPLIASAALQEKVVTPLTTIYDTGSISIGNQYNPQVIYTFPDWKTHGAVNVYSAIAQSCNVYFYTIGGGYGDIQGLGIERIKKYLDLFGLGEKTGIDLPEEASGLVPDPEWKKNQKKEDWYLGDTYHVSIGQGDLLVTPLQMAMAISSIANGGKLFRPYLVDKIVDSDKNVIKAFDSQLIRQNFINPDYLKIARQGMREAVTAGSAAFLRDLPFGVAGKTGTAQLAGQEKNNAWFVGFAPYENPKIVLAILIENVGEGSSYAVPVAKEVLKEYFNK